ncbi:hypothetical protein R5R35_005982 [Gryllus longicercus]|uniref:Ig-like domain-containing protein n=1 Tax=Gryllus longicercus TaxID=2509291 RepID=A0AAN9Z4M7_9ORTH
MEGQRVTVQCRAGRALQYCRIEHTTPRAGQERSTWNLNEDLPQSSDGVKYAGAGLESGQCGFTVQRLPASFNGGFRCTMGFRNLPEEGIGVFNITVAVAPNAPDLAVSSSGQRPSYGSGYGSNDRYPSRDESEFRDGDTLTASCTIRDSRPPANISWFLDDQEVTRGLTNLETIHTTDRDLFTVKQNLTYQLSWRDHGKMLRCVAGHLALEDSNRNNQTSAAVNVKFAPRPHSNPIDQFGFIVGVPGEIAVEVNAYPKPTVSWKINEEVVQENSAGYDGHFHASSLMNNGSGSWTAVLRINEVNMEDIEREYALSARNELGEETYRIRLSTSSEPIVTSLEAGAIIGIVVAILVLLLAIFLLVFARTTGRWCFAGGVSKQDPKESSDTESADHGPTHSSKKSKTKFSNIFKKKGDKVGDDSSVTKEVDSPAPQRSVQPQQQQLQTGQPPHVARQPAPDSIVYAELDLKDLGDRRPQVRPDEERTEYAEILYTAKPAGGPEHTSPPQP